MQFRAHIKTGSHIHTLWKVPGRVAGYVSEVRFNRYSDDFITDVLEPQQVSVLRHHSMVVMEAIGTPVVTASLPPVSVVPEAVVEAPPVPPKHPAFPVRPEEPVMAPKSAPAVPPWAQSRIDRGKRR